MNITRRSALQRTAVLSLGAALSPISLVRGFAHVSALLTLPDVEIAYLAEVDPKRLERSLKAVTDRQGSTCEGVRDFRRFLEDKTLDAIFIATPNYWHTPAALLAMQAG